MTRRTLQKWLNEVNQMHKRTSLAQSSSSDFVASFFTDFLVFVSSCFDNVSNKALSALSVSMAGLLDSADASLGGFETSIKSFANAAIAVGSTENRPVSVATH